MELQNLFRGAGWRWWLLLVIPMLTLLAVFARAGVPTTLYRVTSTVNVQAPAPQVSVASSTVAVDTFVGALSLASVADATAAQVGGITPSAVSDGLSSSRVGSSNLIQVSFAGRDAAKGPEVLQTAIAEAQKVVLTPGAQAAAAAVAQATADLKTAQAAYANKVESFGLVDPAQQYRTALTHVNQLKLALQKARTLSQSTTALEAALATAQAEATTIGNQVAALDPYASVVDQAKNHLIVVRNANTASQAQFKNLTDPSSVKVTAAHKQAATTAILRTAVAAITIGLFVAIIVIAFLQLLRRGSRQPATTPATVAS
jgi:hypothetical protein